ncbi:MAG: hypothetical protein CFE21_03745 [Bacteroidetes bacterium B1(2017)]|nr:MAG: hypothetical protein CFE21_03745 [Bacteroidetes bacterium B1(2017)]
MRTLLLIALSFLSFTLSAQEYVSKNYASNTYPAHPYMWDAVQDAYGRIYFANNKGVVRFDGHQWYLFKTPYAVRHLCFGPTGNLFLACAGDFGTLEFSQTGKVIYTSISKQLPAANQKTGGNEQVFVLGKSVYFVSNKVLVQAEPKEGSYEFTVQELAANYGAFTFEGNLYLNTADLGVAALNKGKLNVINGGELLANSFVSATCTNGKELLLTGSKGNFYTLSKNKIREIALPKLPNVIDMAALPNGYLVAATLNDGLKIWNGKTITWQSISTPSQEMYSVFVDADGSIWGAHSKGITQYASSLPIAYKGLLNQAGTITDMLVYNNALYVSSTAGLFKTDLSLTGVLTKVSGIESECWDLNSWHNNLYVASTDGLFTISNDLAKNILEGETILHVQEGNVSGNVYALGESGVYKVAPGAEPSLLKNLPPLCNSILENAKGVAYAGTYQAGLFAASGPSTKIPASLKEGEAVLKLFNNKALIIKGDSVFELDANTGAINLTTDYAAFAQVKNKEFSLSNNFILVNETGLKVYNNNTFQEQSVAYGIPGKPTAYVKNGDTYFLAFEDKLYVVKDELKTQNNSQVNISMMSFGKQELAFAGFFVSKDGRTQELQEWNPQIAHELLPVHVYFGMSSNQFTEKQECRYKLEGLGNTWSEWQKEFDVKLDGINGGTYTIWVQGKDAFGNSSKETAYKFYINVPWYLSGWAYLMYIMAGFLVVYLIVFINQKRLLSTNRKLEGMVQDRTKELVEEKAKSDELLLNILPVEVADELKRTGSLEAKQFEEVTVLFTDFVGFTSISERLTPKELVEEIHYCFKGFDAIIGDNKLEKIKTIGDAYMAVCGMPIKDKDHAKRCVQTALDIQAFMKVYQQERKALGKPYFEIRIGINSGSVIAGIVGVKKFAYDIWGDTVNTAARMEQNCEPGKINISGSTHELVKDGFKCSYRGKIEAKNKGRIDMFYVMGE